MQNRLGDPLALNGSHDFLSTVNKLLADIFTVDINNCSQAVQYRLAVATDDFCRRPGCWEISKLFGAKRDGFVAFHGFENCRVGFSLAVISARNASQAGANEYPAVSHNSSIAGGTCEDSVP